MSLEGTIVETPLYRLATHAWKAIAGVGAVSIIVGLIALIGRGRPPSSSVCCSASFCC